MRINGDQLESLQNLQTETLDNIGSYATLSRGTLVFDVDGLTVTAKWEKSGYGGEWTLDVED